jgi:hypothetical protein
MMSLRHISNTNQYFLITFSRKVSSCILQIGNFGGFSELDDKAKGCLLQSLLKGLSLTLSAYLGNRKRASRSPWGSHR